jgi:multiple antibiotic resistance protein
VFAFIILIFFGVAGELLLAAMGISLMSFQIAGGIILLVFSISMVLGDPPSAAKSQLDREGDMLNIAIYPVATPIIAGPGSILAIILLTDNNRFTVSEQATTLGVLAVVLSLLLVIFRNSTGILLRKVIDRSRLSTSQRVDGIGRRHSLSRRRHSRGGLRGGYRGIAGRERVASC